MSAGRRRASAFAPVLATVVAVLSVCSLATSARAAPSPRAVAAQGPAPKGQLSAAGRIEAPGGGVIHRYRQRAGGLPVLGAEAVVAEPPRGGRLLVADSTARVRPRDPAGAISRVAAIRAAERATDTQRLRAAPSAELGIDPHGGALAWQVSLPAAAPVADLVVVVDARSGREIRASDVLQEATAGALIFDPTPVTTQGGSAGLRDDKDHDSPLLTGLRSPVGLPRITSVRGCLIGLHVDARLGRTAERVCDPGLDFSGLTRARNRFEAVMAYYHIDRTRAYVDSLALSEALRSAPQRVRADAISDDNSYFSPMTRSMTLGTGGVDDGEDADVIVHEYGHSLQDQAVHNFGVSRGGAAVGEGFGDYLAASMSALTTGGSPFDACIFDWDAASYSPTGCGRRADKPIDLKTAERKCRFEPHCTGKAWSSLLWKLRGTLGNDLQGRSVIDRIVLESHFMYMQRSGFGDAVRALLAADRLLYGGAHLPALLAELVARRFCPASGC